MMMQRLAMAMMQRPRPMAVKARVVHESAVASLDFPSVHIPSAVRVAMMKQASALRNQFF